MTSIRALEQEGESGFMVDNQRQMEQNSIYHASPMLDGNPNRGRIYIEGRVKEDFTGDLERIHSEIVRVFSLEIVQSLSILLWQEMLESDACTFINKIYCESLSHRTFLVKGLFPEQLLSLRAVEYVEVPTFEIVNDNSPDFLENVNIHQQAVVERSSTYFPINSIVLEVHIYRMTLNLEHLEDDGTILQAEIIQLPSFRFEGVWERLVFDADMRGNLIRLVTNILKFSRALSAVNLRPRTNRLILLSGPPGTGKTTLCQALAQKLSIRLNRNYSSTNLVQINAATLLSKFFSESAKHILQIFTAVLAHCTSSPSRFTIVLVDEIESLASSRHTASSRGEVQDTIRATNALLTGFDKVKSQPNLIVLCTSNMADTLDAAFLDRCGHRIIVGEPSLPARYHILRDGIQDLIAAGIIRENDNEDSEEKAQRVQEELIEHTQLVVPSYRDAQLELLSQPKRPGSMLVRLCNILNPSTCQPRSGIEGRGRTSARYLGQLPEVALADQMISDSCSLQEAMEHIEKFVHGQTMLDAIQTHAQREIDGGEDSNWESGLSLKRKRI